jgi:tetratricopeptide (TPR) repeat protein
VVALVVSTVLIAREHQRAEEALRAKEAALVQARANYEAAEANVQLARQAVDEMYARLQQDPLHVQARTPPLRRDAVLNALQFYQQLARQERTEPVMRRERALAMTRVGDIQHRLGRHSQALEAYTELIALLEGLAAEFPSRASSWWRSSRTSRLTACN